MSSILCHLKINRWGGKAIVNMVTHIASKFTLVTEQEISLTGSIRGGYTPWYPTSPRKVFMKTCLFFLSNAVTSFHSHHVEQSHCTAAPRALFSSSYGSFLLITTHKLSNVFMTSQSSSTRHSSPVCFPIAFSRLRSVIGSILVTQ